MILLTRFDNPMNSGTRGILVMAAVAVVIASVTIGATFVSSLQTSATTTGSSTASSHATSNQQIEQTIQTVTLTRSSPSPTISYTIEIWTNNTQGVISKVTITQAGASSRTQTIQFYVSVPSFVFAKQRKRAKRKERENWLHQNGKISSATNYQRS